MPSRVSVIWIVCRTSCQKENVQNSAINPILRCIPVQKEYAKSTFRFIVTVDSSKHHVAPFYRQFSKRISSLNYVCPKKLHLSKEKKTNFKKDCHNRARCKRSTGGRGEDFASLAEVHSTWNSKKIFNKTTNCSGSNLIWLVYNYISQCLMQILQIHFPKILFSLTETKW